MIYLSRPLARQRQKGSVAIEAAFVIAFILVPLLAFVLCFGRYFWYYTITQKAAHDATLYLASAPLADIRSGAATLAEGIIGRELADMDETTLATKGVSTVCLYRIPASSSILSVFPCNINATPAVVRASIGITVYDPFLAPITGPIIGSDGLTILAGATMRYVGR